MVCGCGAVTLAEGGEPVGVGVAVGVAVAIAVAVAVGVAVVDGDGVGVAEVVISPFTESPATSLAPVEIFSCTLPEAISTLKNLAVEISAVQKEAPSGSRFKAKSRPGFGM